MTGTRIRSLRAEPLDIPLHEPFVIAIGRLDRVRNALVTVELENGVIGYGEAAPLEPISGEDQGTVLATIASCRRLVEGADALAWRPLARALAGSFHAQAAARTGIEMAVLDAAAKSCRIPLWRWFGGASDRVETDCTVPIVPAARAAVLADGIAAQGIRTIKIKVGSGLEEDLDRVIAVHAEAPDRRLILDANQGCTPTEALELLRRLGGHGIRPALLEQPVHRHDRAGLAAVAARADCPIAADEAVVRASDVVDLAGARACAVVNIKLQKSGIVEALDIAAAVRATHLRPMIGAMIESRLAIGCSAAFAAGLGGFAFVDLDTPFLLAEDPFEGGHTVACGELRLDAIVAGLGCWPRGRPRGFLP